MGPLLAEGEKNNFPSPKGNMGYVGGFLGNCNRYDRFVLGDVGLILFKKTEMMKKRFFLAAMILFALTACKEGGVKVNVNVHEKVVGIAKQYGDHIVRGCGLPSDSISTVVAVMPIPISDWIILSATKQADILVDIERAEETARVINYRGLLDFHTERLVVAKYYDLYLRSLPSDSNEAIAYMLVYKSPTNRFCNVFVDGDFRFVARKEEYLFDRCLDQFVGNYDLEEIDILVERGLIEEVL